MGIPVFAGMPFVYWIVEKKQKCMKIYRMYWMKK